MLRFAPYTCLHRVARSSLSAASAHSTRGSWDKNLEGPFTIATISPHTCQRHLLQTLPVCLPSHPGDLTTLPLHQNNNIIILYGPLDPIGVPLLYYLLVGDSRSIFIASPPHLTAPD